MGTKRQHLKRINIIKFSALPPNIAEGAARKGVNEFVHFLYIALRSTAELQTQIKIAKNLGYKAEYSSVEDNIVRIMKCSMTL